ncbi:MAG: deoxyribodipyrimidine photo-lyase [Bacteroidota bacterium]
MNTTKQSVTLFWFRRDLRLSDNHGLYEALKSSDAVLPVFIFDKNILEALENKKDKRVSFIHQTLKNLNDELLKVGSSLYVLYAEPLEAFKTICKTFDVKAVFTNHDYEPYAIQRDEELTAYFNKKNIPFQTFKDQVIFEKSEVMKSDGTPYTIFTPYSKLWKEKFRNESQQLFPSEVFKSNYFKTKPIYFPSLREIGFEETTFTVPSIEVDKTIIRNYHETRNLPAVDGTSKLSVHLRFGTVSVRKLAQMAAALNDQWLNELIWREFFMMILFLFPEVVTKSFKKKYDNIAWRNDEEEFLKWCNGVTGFPIVDAGMRELNETGLMHNRVRMVVASFLTKHLLIDWRWGESYFAEKLLDYELSSNNGNWQWSAGCGCDAAPYFRIFNPEEQTKRFDPENKYINRWVKEFSSADYCKPIVEHRFARNRALTIFKNSLQ